MYPGRAWSSFGLPIFLAEPLSFGWLGQAHPMVELPRAWPKGVAWAEVPLRAPKEARPGRSSTLSKAEAPRPRFLRQAAESS